MNPSKFEHLLKWVAPYIEKSSEKRVDVPSPVERLCVTMGFLSSGNSQTTIASSYRISPITVGRIISETCSALWIVLVENGYLKVPDSVVLWKNVARQFEDMWNFPHCVGALDGKHVLQAPQNCGSDWFNYKHTPSIVLLAVCNAVYEFLLVDIGDAARQSDGGVYNNSSLGYAIDNNMLSIPEPEPINGYDTAKQFPYVFVADDAFQLKNNMVKPYSRCNLDHEKNIFNCRISRARRIIENKFGIAALRFRIFRRPIIAKVETVVGITKAVVALHNFLMRTRSADDINDYCPINLLNHRDHANNQLGQEVSEGLIPLQTTGSNNYSPSAKETRGDFKQYFNSLQGAVTWQNEIVTRNS